MAVIPFKWALLCLISTFSAPGASLDSNTENVAITKHPFFISVTEVAYNSTEKTMEVSCKIFADDMEDVLKKNYKTPVDLTNAKQRVQTDKLITDYVVKHLGFTIDNKPVKLRYVGYEKEKESVYCYLEVPDIAVVKKVSINNGLLQDFNNTQINIMHVIVNGKRQSTKLDYPNKQADFQF